jgi:hypothetical protein
MRTLRLVPRLACAATGVLAVSALACSASTRATPTHEDGGPTADSAADANANTSSILSESAISTVSGCSDEHEPTIAVAPNGHVAVSFDAYCAPNRSQIITGYRISTDFGVSWGPATLFPLPAGENEEGNSSVAADSQGNLYIAWAVEDHTLSGRSNVHVYAAKAGPTDVQFGAPVDIFDAPAGGSVDSPRIAVTASGTINVTFAYFTSDGGLYLADATSTDMTTWAVAPVVPQGTLGGVGNFSHICQSATSSRIFLAYQSYDLATLVSGVAVVLTSSDDDGKTWAPPVEVSLPDEEYEMMYFMDCATNGTEVWVLYSLSPAANEDDNSIELDVEPPASRLRLAHSPDGSGTIDWRENVGDADSLFLVPTLVGEGSDALDLSFVDGLTLGGPAAVRWSRATDGKTFSPSTLVSQGLTLATDREAPSWMGDYNGRAFAQGDLYLVYADNSSGSSHVGFYRAPVSAQVASDAGESTNDSAVPLFDAGFPSCLGTDPFTPIPWAPPSPFGENVCSSAQIAAYNTCATSATGDCSAFRASSENAGCLACIETGVGATQHGPVVTETVDGGIVPVETNVGGCLAHFDGQTGPMSCGALTNASTDCIDAECSTCSDFTNPAQGGPTEGCYYGEVLPGEPCGGFLVTTACANEPVEGGVAPLCGSSLSDLLTSWCGP